MQLGKYEEQLRQNPSYTNDMVNQEIQSKFELMLTGVEDRIYEILKKMDVEKVWINPDCGLKTRGNAETWPSLENLVAAAKAVRAKLAK